MEWLLPALKRPDVLAWGARFLMVLGVLLGAFAVLSELRYRRRWTRYYGQALYVLRLGWISKAEEIFQEAAQWSYGTRRTVVLAGVGICRMHQGRYAEAVAILEPLMERRLPRWMWVDEIALRGHLALSLAMLGETRRAWHWLNEACHRFGGMVTFLVLPEVAILCREGYLGAALKRLEKCWPVVKADGLACGRLRLFRAYAQRKVDPERHAELVTMTLYSLAPFREEELAFCREHWPVLADFMQQGQELVAGSDPRRIKRVVEWPE